MQIRFYAFTNIILSPSFAYFKNLISSGSMARDAYNEITTQRLMKKTHLVQLAAPFIHFS